MAIVDTLSFQLFSARSISSLPAQFELLAGLGYSYVELFGGVLGDIPTLKSLLAQHGMRAPSAHVGLDVLREDPKRAADLYGDLGVELMIVPAPPPAEREGDEARWRRLGRELQAIGARIRGEGMRFAWHNHHWEYGKTAQGLTYLECLFDEAPDLLWEADLAWIKRGGGDPVAEIVKHANRLVAVHIKDIAPEGECREEDGWADPGHGVMDWKAIRPALARTGVKLFVVEHDNPSDVARFARRARETIATWV